MLRTEITCASETAHVSALPLYTSFAAYDQCLTQLSNSMLRIGSIENIAHTCKCQLHLALLGEDETACIGQMLVELHLLAAGLAQAWQPILTQRLNMFHLIMY